MNPEVITALGRLNAHARRTGAWGTERRAVYVYKTLAALLLHEAGQVGLRFIKIETKCTCDGGWWITYYGHGDMDKRCCYRCNGTAKVTLRFSETTLPDGQIWHHPWETRDNAPGPKFKPDGIDADGLEWQGAGDWTPRSPAIELPLPELIALLNLAEDWVETVEDRSWPGPHHWEIKAAKGMLTKATFRGVIGRPSIPYRIDLGRTNGGCEICGRMDELHSYNRGHMHDLFHWSAPICKDHEREPYAKTPPAELLDVPGLDKWTERHSRVQEVRH